MDAQPALPVPAPQRVHSPTGVAWATICGTPIAGGIVLALNYWKWGRKGLAAAAVAGGFLTTALLGWLGWIVPASVPALVFLPGQIVLGYFAARWLQGGRFDAHRATGGTRVSPGTDALIGLGVTAVLIGVVAFGFLGTGLNPGAVLDPQDSVDFGNGQLVFYSDGATRDDAQNLGEALFNARYFDDLAPAEVSITGQGSSRVLSFVGADGAWDDPANLEYMRELTEYLAPDIGGKPFTVILLDPKLYEKKRCILDDDWKCSPAP